ncbi:MAG: thrombospondin type 3 repeat-containing protein [Deltaproteobacteria bacterium]|nr:thrombospondin type 3 repeat-containing protein [Deltaproteobacteria bacterium]
MGEFGALVGLPAQLALGLVVPVAFQVRGGGPNLVQLQANPQAPALGDVRVEGRKGLWTGSVGGGDGQVGAAAVWNLPTADATSWLGGAHALSLQAFFGGTWGPWRADAGLGARLTAAAEHRLHPLKGDGTLDHTTDVVALRAGSTADIWAAAGHTLLDGQLLVRGELRATVGVITTVPDRSAVVDAVASVRWRFFPWLHGLAGVGGSPTAGAGSAGVRVLAGLQFSPGELPSDVDGDGLDDKVDRCPAQAEDRDGFADADGCPDTDDDDDGVPDVRDRCRMVPEDRDGFEDGDGCPDLDDDGDGIVDTKDLCPRKPEDHDGRDDDDGCPDLDDDGDGIADKDDLCPQQPERKNGYEDADGCPDFAPGEAPPPIGLPEPATPESAPAPAAPPAPVAPGAPSPAPAKAPDPAAKKAPPPAPSAGKAPPPKDAPPSEDGKPKVKVKPIAP